MAVEQPHHVGVHGAGGPGGIKRSPGHLSDMLGQGITHGMDKHTTDVALLQLGINMAKDGLPRGSSKAGHPHPGSLGIPPLAVGVGWSLGLEVSPPPGVLPPIAEST